MGNGAVSKKKRGKDAPQLPPAAGDGPSTGKGGKKIPNGLVEEPPALRDETLVTLSRQNKIPYRLTEMANDRFKQLDSRYVHCSTLWCLVLLVATWLINSLSITLTNEPPWAYIRQLQRYGNNTSQGSRSNRST